VAAALLPGCHLVPATWIDGSAPADAAQDDTSVVLVRRSAWRAPGSGPCRLSWWGLAALEELVMLVLSAIAAFDAGDIGHGFERHDLFDTVDNDFYLTA
jgi:hypothetical protein